MGRWKDNGLGQAYFDPNDSGPDQIAPPTMEAPGPAATPAPPASGGPLYGGIKTPRDGQVAEPSSDPIRKLPMPWPNGGVTLSPGEGGQWDMNGTLGPFDQHLMQLQQWGGGGGAIPTLPAQASPVAQAAIATRGPLTPGRPGILGGGRPSGIGVNLGTLGR